MPPVLVTPPADPLVPWETCRDYCFLRGQHYDQMLLVGLRDAAEAYLDGYAGVLGRSLQPTTWREEFEGWGDLRLTLPDVVPDQVDVTGLDVDGVQVPGEVEFAVKRDKRGWYVRASGPAAESVQVEYVAAAPKAVLDVATVIVLLLVKHWYHRREVVGDNSNSEVPFAASALIANIRRGQIA